MTLSGSLIETIDKWLAAFPEDARKHGGMPLIRAGVIEIVRQHEDSTLASLENAKHDTPNHPRSIGFNEGLDVAIALVRQYDADQVREVTKMVSSEISDNKPEFDAEKARKALKPAAWELLKTPIIQSLLYDINLLPEQITTGKHWFYMLSILSHFDQATKPEPVSGLVSVMGGDSGSASLSRYEPKSGGLGVDGTPPTCATSGETTPHVISADNTLPPTEQPVELLETLAMLEHEQWMQWAKTILMSEQISVERRNRWIECFQPYHELTEEQKEHDRIWARKIMAYADRLPERESGSEWEKMRGLPMSEIKVGMKLKSTAPSQLHDVVVTELTDKGFKYSCREYYVRAGGISGTVNSGECYGHHGYSMYTHDVEDQAKRGSDTCTACSDAEGYCPKHDPRNETEDEAGNASTK